ncbi:MAG: protein translocase subunit SecF [Proteobacteria bacterium]|nr:protein translocase subunit SecF [Pseudomonadota bacterium]
MIKLFPMLRLVPDKTDIKFMKGRFIGLIVSALLSVLSVGLFFYPGMNYGIDFKGGIVIEVRTPQDADFTKIRAVLSQQNVGQAGLQQFGGNNDVLIRLERQPGDEAAQQRAVERVRGALTEAFPGLQVRRVEAVGASVSQELFVNGMTAMGLSFVAMLIYIWFRFEWQFGIGAVVTLLLDTTKMIGFYVITDFQFNLVAIAAMLTVMGYSINDKVVVYDRVRENLRKYKSMSLRDLIDLSINETLSRTIGTSIASLLATLPLALFGGEALEEFAWSMVFGIFLATSSSIFIAAPILLFLGEDKLRRGPPPGKTEGEAADKTTAPATP